MKNKSENSASDPDDLDAEILAEEQRFQELERELALDLAQAGLDTAGILDPTPTADLTSAGISLYRGDLIGAGLSTISAVPYVGDLLGKSAKMARTAKKVNDLKEALKASLKRKNELLKRKEDVSDNMKKAKGAADKKGGDKPDCAVQKCSNKKDEPDYNNSYEFDNLDDFNRAANNPKPNSVYKYKDYTWKTDEKGRVIEASGKIDLESLNGRKGIDGVSTTAIGKEGQTGDVGFHLIGDQFGGPTNRLNVVPGNGKRVDPDGPPNLNQGAYAKFEKAIKKARNDPNNIGKDIEVKVVPVYNSYNKTNRPDYFEAEYRIGNDKRKEFLFENRQGL